MKVQVLTCCLYTVIFAFTMSYSALGNTECNETLKQVQAKVGKLSTTEMASFFKTFTPVCMQGTEFSEWSNELLFSILVKQPREFIEVLKKQDEAKVKTILSEIESPVNDNIDIKVTYGKVIAVKTTSKMRQRIIRALQVAAGKGGLVLK